MLALYSMTLGPVYLTEEAFFFFSISSSFSSRYIPTVSVDGESIKIADPRSREDCLKGYTFLLESEHLVLVIQSLLYSL